MKAGGTGLGLAISKRYIELMGGELELDSEPGRGSRFFFTIPLTPAASDALVHPSSWRGVSRLAAGYTVKALVCDDTQVNRDVLGNLLSSLGVSVLEAENGQQGVQMTRQHRPDIVFMDIRMPVMDGIEASRQLWQEFEPDALKIVAISASSLTHQREEYLQAGFDDFISKPFRFERVCECLATLLDVAFETEAAAETDSAAGQPTEVGDVSLPEELLAQLKAAAELHKVTQLRTLHDEVLARVETHLTIKRLADGLREANDQIQAQNDELERKNQLLAEAFDRLATDNIRKTEELETARIIQQGFLPRCVPELPYLEIAAFQKPATEVGGDYYDFFLEPCEGSEPSQGFAHDAKRLVAIGDATGHGVGASLMVSATKMALRLVDEPNLARKIAEINTHLKQINTYHRLNMALTLAELSHDEMSGAVNVKATGGSMPPLIILRSNGDVEEIMIEGLPLGAMEGATYRVTEFRLEKSDLLILMSDGLPERINDKGEMLGDGLLAAEIQKAGKMGQNAKEILDALVQFGDDWSNQTPQNDDVTLVVLKVK